MHLTLCYSICLPQQCHICGFCLFSHLLMIILLFIALFLRSHTISWRQSSLLWARNLLCRKVSSCIYSSPLQIQVIIILWCCVSIYTTVPSAAFINASLFPIPRSLIQMWNERTIHLEFHFLPFNCKDFPSGEINTPKSSCCWLLLVPTFIWLMLIWVHMYHISILMTW